MLTVSAILRAGLSQARVGYASHVVCEVGPTALDRHRGSAGQLGAVGLCPGQHCVLELVDCSASGTESAGDSAGAQPGPNCQQPAEQQQAALAQFLAELQEVRSVLCEVIGEPIKRLA